MKKIFSWVLWFTLGATTAVRAEVQLPALFSDNMVLQQGAPVTIWGWANDGDVVTVRFRGHTVSATTHNLKWSVKLRPLKAGGPDDLSIGLKTRSVALTNFSVSFTTETQTLITLTNVMVGEVWVCSGQSNMEWPLSRAFAPEADIASATNALIRLFRVPKAKAEAPTVRVNAAWTECSPETAARFSAVGYYFGRDLQAARKVPVGLIQSDWGGSPAEVWMSREALELNDDHRTNILEAGEKAWSKYLEAMGAYKVDKALAESKGEKFKKEPPRFGWRPTELYNAMIAPLIPYTIKGAIWYQGESNAGRAEQYRSLFADMIRNWRRDWGQGDFPFLCVQLAPWDKNKKRSLEQITEKPEDSEWAELREAQYLATKNLPKVGMAVITDVGDKDDIHPTKKQPVGARLALAARTIAYGEKIESSGPIYREMKVSDGKVILQFDHAGKGLIARDGDLKGFAICGADRKFVWAKAEIVAKDKVAVSSPEVPNPVAVRYGWSDYPVVNLWNQDGLPASPFRTDDFPMVTAGKR